MPSALCRQPDEKIVVAGNISDATPKGLVCRFDVAGKADEGFADKGVYVLGNLHVGAMSIRADSTIALVGAGTRQEESKCLFLVKRDGLGKPDPTFNKGKCFRCVWQWLSRTVPSHQKAKSPAM